MLTRTFVKLEELHIVSLGFMDIIINGLIHKHHYILSQVDRVAR